MEKHWQKGEETYEDEKGDEENTRNMKGTRMWRIMQNIREWDEDTEREEKARTKGEEEFSMTLASRDR